MKRIICDSCESDLTFSNGVTNYYLNLTMDRSKDMGGITFDVYIPPILDNTKNFCGMGCLKSWVEKK